MPENSKAFLKCFESFCVAEGLLLIKGGVYSVLCIGINSAATIFCIFLTMFLSGRYYHCCTIFCIINEEIAS